MVPVHSGSSDTELIRGCVAGPNAARCTSTSAMKRTCRQRSAAPWERGAPTLGLVEDLTNEVLESLWEESCRRLRAYDASRSGLATYLRVLAGQVVRQCVRQLAFGQARQVPLGDRDLADARTPL